MLTTTERQTARTSSEVVFVTDVSQSMLAAPRAGAPTRLDRARSVVRRMRAAVPDVPAGVAGLTDRALPYVFPTLDAGVFADTVKRSVLPDAPQPQGIADVASNFVPVAQLARNGFFSPEARHRTCVLVTDGETRSVLPAPRGCTLIVVQGGRAGRQDLRPERQGRCRVPARELGREHARPPGAGGRRRPVYGAGLGAATAALRKAAEVGASRRGSGRGRPCTCSRRTSPRWRWPLLRWSSCGAIFGRQVESHRVEGDAATAPRSRSRREVACRCCEDAVLCSRLCSPRRRSPSPRGRFDLRERARVVAPGDWPAFGRTVDNNRYSPLTEITPENVGQLGRVYTKDFLAIDSDTRRGQQSYPLAIGGTLYVTTNDANVFAIDGATGKILWQRKPQNSAVFKNFGVAANRGLAYCGGKLFILQLDMKLVAIRPSDG